MAMTLTDAAVAVLTTAKPAEKTRLSRVYAAAWASGDISEVGNTPLPDRPARPDAPPLLPPRDMPRRGTGPGRRTALLHALAHIELTAVDLAWDITARFHAEALPKAFYDDWVQVALEEALHFDMLDAQLHALSSHYGAMAAHDGLWQAAERTAHALAARLTIVPLTHEARGLDTTPATLERLRGHPGQEDLVNALEIIYRDEINHVAAGARWLKWLAARDGIDPGVLFRDTLAAHYKGDLKPPFNDEARALAGMPQDWYDPPTH